MPVGQGGQAVRRGLNFLARSQLDLIVDPFLILALGQHARVEHLTQDVVAPLLVFLHAGSPAVILVWIFAQRIIAGRSVGDGDQGRGFRDIQLADVLVKIELGRTLDAVALIGKESDVEVGLQNLLFAVVLFELERGENLLDLSFRGDLVVAGQVFDDLLGDGGTALDTGGAAEIAQRGADGSQPVHTVVLPEALVLRRDGDVDERLRDLAVADPLAVLSGVKLFDNRLFLGVRIGHINIRSIVEIHLYVRKVDNRGILQGVENIQRHNRDDNRTGDDPDKNHNGKSAAQRSKKASDRSTSFCCCQINLLLLIVLPHPRRRAV